MSKQLKEIKELINKYQDCYNGEIALRYARDLMRYHAKWLIKQAERAAELEQIIKSHAPEGRNYTNAQYVNLLQQNKRYREILKKIVSVKNDEEFNPYAYMIIEIIGWAEEALRGESNE